MLLFGVMLNCCNDGESLLHPLSEETQQALLQYKKVPFKLQSRRSSKIHSSLSLFTRPYDRSTHAARNEQRPEA